MIKINKVNNSLTVEGVDNVFYPNNGDNSYPLNSLIIVTDDSNMATFRSVATNDVLFSGLIDDITINGEQVTKDNIVEKFDAVSNSTSAGGGVDAYSKDESDAKYATKDELNNVSTVANDADTKADAVTSRIEDVETAMDDKQDTLVSGVNIKTVNSQSILGSGDLTISGVSDEQAQEIAKIPTLETELAQKANVSDVPTVQTGYRGTNKNYVYSNNSSPYAGIISKVYPMPSADKINLRQYLWTDDTSKLSYLTEFLTKATTTSAGVMSAADKTKLDSIPENIPTQTEIDDIAADVSALEADMMGKQPTLVSGTNIKTINGESILGEGDLAISGGSSTPVTHTISIEKYPGDEYNGLGYNTLLLGLNSEQYDIDSINVGDELILKRGGYEYKDIVKKGNILGSGNEKKYITLCVINSGGGNEIRNVVLESSTQLFAIPIIAPANANSLPPKNRKVYGVVDTQVEKWNSTADIKNYYDYKIGSTGVIGYGYVPTIDSAFKGIVYKNTIKDNNYVATSINENQLFFIGNSLDNATTYTIGKGNDTGTLMKTAGYQDVTINADGSWTIPMVDEYQDMIYYNTAIYKNGELIKSQGSGDSITWNVGDKIQCVSEAYSSTEIFSGFQDKKVNFNINVSFATIVNTDASNQLINQFNGKSYNIRSEANEWNGTQAEFDALATKDDNIIYYVTE